MLLTLKIGYGYLITKFCLSHFEWDETRKHNFFAAWPLSTIREQVEKFVPIREIRG